MSLLCRSCRFHASWVVKKTVEDPTVSRPLRKLLRTQGPDDSGLGRASSTGAGHGEDSSDPTVAVP